MRLPWFCTQSADFDCRWNTSEVRRNQFQHHDHGVHGRESLEVVFRLNFTLLPVLLCWFEGGGELAWSEVKG